MRPIYKPMHAPLMLDVDIEVSSEELPKFVNTSYLIYLVSLHAKAQQQKPYPACCAGNLTQEMQPQRLLMHPQGFPNMCHEGDVVILPLQEISAPGFLTACDEVSHLSPVLHGLDMTLWQPI